MGNKVLITEDFDPLLAKGLTSLGFECDSRSGISQSEVTEIIHNYEGIVVATRIHIDHRLIDSGILLRFIARAGSGMENIDIEYAKAKNISCINSPEGNANSVAEHAVGLLLAMFHNITKSSFETSKSEWRVEENRVHELEGKTIGIIGYGNTGKGLAKKLQPFNMRVLAYDKYLHDFSDAFAEESTMHKIFTTAEIISFHIPLTDETRWLVNKEYFECFAKALYVVNTSRGKIIRHMDLLQAIRNGKVLNAALDVFENENFSSHSVEEQEVFHELVSSGKVIFTAHIAGKSFESKKKIAEVLVKKIAALY